MIREYQNEESVLLHSKDSSKSKSVSKTKIQQRYQRKQKQITVKFDIELSNQLAFLANELEDKQLRILRQLVKKKIQSLGLWSVYLSSPKKYYMNEVLKGKKKI